MSEISMLIWAGVALAMIIVGLIIGFVYLGVVLSWEDQRTVGTAYYGLSPKLRDRFRKRLRFHARLLRPIVRIAARLTRVTLAKASFRFEGVAGPKGTCTLESFEAGHTYRPSAEDVFVVTQMKCGTTWMQHVVYQVLLRGKGDLAETGQTLYSVSPWLEGVRSVSMFDAPIVGEECPSRVIKTHFPSGLCPFDPVAKYIYVVRHPVSCFASCVDFIRANLGAFAPDLAEIREWFCSHDDMWWGSWPRHVEGWWKLSETNPNVLFVRFEDMKSDLQGVTARVADFLGIAPLRDDEMSGVVTKCGFEYMRSHSGSFEMHPPHLLAVNAELFVKGTSDRYRDVSTELRSDIMSWCDEQLAGGDFPRREHYPAEG